MSKYLGDLALSAVVRGSFNTRTAAGVPITLGGTPALSVYKDGSVSQSTAGVTLTTDFDSITGHHLFAIDTSADGTFYSTGSDFRVVITTGTVDSVSVVGSEVGSFSLNNRASLRPTIGGRTLDVSANGNAGIDWNNVDTPSATQNLSATTIKTATDVETDTSNIQTRIPAALVSGRIDSTVGAMASNVLVAAAVDEDVITAISAQVASDLLAAHGSGSWQTATGFSTLDAAGVRSAVGLASANLDSQLLVIVTDTNEVQTDLANGGRLDLLIDGIKAKTDNTIQVGTAYTHTNNSTDETANVTITGA